MGKFIVTENCVCVCVKAAGALCLQRSVLNTVTLGWSVPAPARLDWDSLTGDNWGIPAKSPR